MFTVYNEYLHRRQSLSEMTFTDYTNFDYHICKQIFSEYAKVHNLPESDDTRKQMLRSFSEYESKFK